MAEEAEVQDAPTDEAEATEAPADAEGIGSGPATPEALADFDRKFAAEYQGKPIPVTEAPAGAEDEPEGVEESPAEAGAASDDDERELDDPAADLRAEVAALREELRASREQGKGSQALLEAAVSESPEINSIESEMRAVDAEIRAAESRRIAIIGEHSSLEKFIAKLEGKLEIAADVDKLDIRDELREKRAELKELVSEYKDKAREVSQSKATSTELARKRAAEIEAIKSTLANRSTQEAQNLAVQQRAKASFNAAFKTEAEKYGIDPSRDKRTGALTDPKARHIEEVIKARVTLHLRRLQAQDPNAPAVDVEKLTSKYWKDEATARGLSTKKAFAAASTARRETRTGIAARGARLPASASSSLNIPPELAKDGNYWRARAAKLSGE